MKLRLWWSDHRAALLRLALVVVIIATLVWLGYKFWRLVWVQGILGAGDLMLRYEEVQLWSAGQPVYGKAEWAAYPPASYVILSMAIARLVVSAAGTMAVGRYRNSRPCLVDLHHPQRERGQHIS